MRKQIFNIVHLMYDKEFLKLYKQYRINETKPKEELLFEQERQLSKLIDFVYKYVPYYTNLFRSLNLIPSDIKKISDLSIIPILTKSIIKDNWNDFNPLNLDKIQYIHNSTGGTTGTPMHYRVTNEQRRRILVTTYRGWGYAGYKLGDKILYFGGTSIGVGKEATFKKNIQNYSRNIIAISAYDLDDNILQNIVNKINIEKPNFIRSFPSAIYFLAKWLKENNKNIHKPKAIFTTSEKLYPNIRKMVEDIFESKIFDNYGLNDGGLSAFECNNHKGMHIDYENSILEVNKEGKNVEHGQGRALATSLYNYAFPFLRYETGDIVNLSETECTCGRKSEIITEIVSRSVDFFITPNKRYIHGWFFYIIMESHSDGIDKYQIVQKDYNLINVNLVTNSDYKKDTGLDIIKLIKEKESDWEVKINFMDTIETTKSGKFKFIFNEILLND